MSTEHQGGLPKALSQGLVRKSYRGSHCSQKTFPFAGLLEALCLEPFKKQGI